ncbi:MAG: YkvA family protein [Jiangellaceae bacterium]
MTAVVSGQWDGLGMGRLALMGLALFYVLSPIDLIPEGLLLALGLVDDVVVVGWLAGSVLDATDRFVAWERGGPQIIDGDVVGERLSLPARTSPMETRAMTRPHPLTAMSERQWAQAWEAQQRVVDAMPQGRGSWLPNLVEARRWGALRWTSGRPAHAATTGHAVAESFAVIRPDVTDRSVRAAVADVLTDRPPVTRIAGVGVREHQVSASVLGAVGLSVVAATVAALAGAGWWLVLVVAALGAVGGAVAGASLADYRFGRAKAAVLADKRVRVVTGRYAPPAWTRLVEATTRLEEISARDHDAEADRQAHEAVQGALWEAAGLLLGSSDHTGVEVLAEGVERLADVRQG